jgi:hypothetical protein
VIKISWTLIRHTYDCDKEGEAEASVTTPIEEDETPCVFENHMQVEDNLVEMQRFASQNGYPAAIVQSFGIIAHQMQVHQINKRSSSTSLLSHGFSKKPRSV